MMPPTHFSSVLLSNWQAIVSRKARPPDPGAPDLVRPLLDFAHPRIAAASAAAYAVEEAVQGRTVELADALARHAQAALDLCMAHVARAGVKLAEAQRRFARFGSHDPFWLECVIEFVEHYALTRHGAVPYKQWSNLTDFVLPPNALPARCRVAVVSDWGTGDARAQALMDAVAGQAPDILVHLGDIYYACTALEANAFYSNCKLAFADRPTRVFTLCGNHDMYSGAAPYYALIDRLGQPASYFCLRNAHWQILAGDTGYNDFNPFDEGEIASWVRDRDEGETFSELDWHRDKLVNAAGRKTILFTHHPLFTRNSSIARQALNPRLFGQFGDYLSEIALWMWGHEHNLALYAPFAGLARGRCVGASAVPVAANVDLTGASGDLDGQVVPTLLADRDGGPIRLSPEARGNLYQLGFATIDLDGAEGRVGYWRFDPSTGDLGRLFEESI